MSSSKKRRSIFRENTKISNLEYQVASLKTSFDLQNNLCRVQRERIEKLEEALRWFRDGYTGCEPSASVMDRFVDELIGSK